jgi:tryptophan 2,3-dioxygenase
MTTPKPGQPVTYAGYLHLDQVLGACRPRTDVPDETLFIRVHQISELAFAQLTDGLRATVAALDEARYDTAVAQLTRASRAVVVATAALDLLATLPSSEFEAFRGALGGASGLHSLGFRVVELLAGRAEDPAYLRTVRAAHGGTLPPPLDHVARERTVAAAHRDVLRREDAPSARLEALRWALADLDGCWAIWRLGHLELVAGLLGDAPGTAGRSLAYLTDQQQPLLPHLHSTHPGDAR